MSEWIRDSRGTFVVKIYVEPEFIQSYSVSREATAGSFIRRPRILYSAGEKTHPFAIIFPEFAREYEALYYNELELARMRTHGVSYSNETQNAARTS